MVRRQRRTCFCKISEWWMFAGCRLWSGRGRRTFLRGLYYRECDGHYFKNSIRVPKAEAEKLGRDLAKRMQDMYENDKTGGTSL